MSAELVTISGEQYYVATLVTSGVNKNGVRFLPEELQKAADDFKTKDSEENSNLFYHDGKLIIKGENIL